MAIAFFKLFGFEYGLTKELRRAATSATRNCPGFKRNIFARKLKWFIPGISAGCEPDDRLI
jgi:hypothetical protein